MTGPPGVGKSTLLGAFIPKLRETGRTVGVIAVDPSSRQTGGALLGARLRLMLNTEDSGVVVRSMASRERLGGLAELNDSVLLLLRRPYATCRISTPGVVEADTQVAVLA